jgi:hypothetical protein
MRKQPAGTHTTRTATSKYQGLSVDFAFTGQTSKNAKRAASYKGLRGESCYILIYDHFTQHLDGEPRISKGSPLDWLSCYLRRNAPNCADKYVVLDQGGELYRNPKVRALFNQYGYDVRPTGADASNQNGPVERSHQTIGNALRSMLSGAGLTAKFWPFAFQHFLRITNALRSAGRALSPYEMTHDRQDDFTRFRTFGSRVWVRPPGLRPAKLRVHTRKGIFLSFLPRTTRNILWFDLDSARVKIAKHARFDEGMNDLPASDLPPNVQHLQRVQRGEALPADQEELELPAFSFHNSPFLDEVDKVLPITCAHPTFGLDLQTCPMTNRAYVGGLFPDTSAATLCSILRVSRRKFIGAYLVAIGEAPIFTLLDANQELRRLRADSTLTSLTFTFALEPLPSAKDRASARAEQEASRAWIPASPAPLPMGIEPHEELTLGIDELRAIHRLRHAPVGPTETSTADILHVVRALSSEALTAEERALKGFTRRKLKQLPTLPLWEAGEHTTF